MAGGLELERGERLAAVVRSRLDTVLLYWACQWLGATFVPLSPRASAADLAYCRDDSGAALFLEVGRGASLRATRTRARSMPPTRTRA